MSYLVGAILIIALFLAFVFCRIQRSTRSILLQFTSETINHRSFQELQSFITGIVVCEVFKYLETLQRKRTILRKSNDYGYIDESRWLDEKAVFLESTLLKSDRNEVFALAMVRFSELYRVHRPFPADADVLQGVINGVLTGVIEQLLDEAMARQTAQPLTLWQRELLVADELALWGWHSILAMRGSTNEVDLIAEAGGKRILVVSSETVADLRLQLDQIPAALLAHGVDKACIVADFDASQEDVSEVEGRGFILMRRGNLKDLTSRCAIDPVANTHRPSLPIQQVGEVGVQYEMECAAILRAKGWDAHLTPTTGDHGVDIIAEKNAVRVAIQCKHQSSSVGISAIQQVAGGRAYYGAKFACVVSNQNFTRAARDHAAANNVLLLSSADLVYLEQRLKQ